MDKGFDRRHEKIKSWRLNGNIDGKSGLDNYLPIHLVWMMSLSGMQCWNSCDKN